MFSTPWKYNRITGFSCNQGELIKIIMKKNLITSNTEGTTEGILEQKIICLRGSKASFNSCRKSLFRRNLFSSVSTVEETVLFPMKREIPLIKSSSPGPSNENSTPHALVSKRKSIFILFSLFFLLANHNWKAIVGEPRQKSNQQCPLLWSFVVTFS